MPMSSRQLKRELPFAVALPFWCCAAIRPPQESRDGCEARGGSQYRHPSCSCTRRWCAPPSSTNSIHSSSSCGMQCIVSMPRGTREDGSPPEALFLRTRRRPGSHASESATRQDKREQCAQHAHLEMILKDARSMAICGGCLHHAGNSNDKAGNWRAPAAGHVCCSNAHSRQLPLQRWWRGRKGRRSCLNTHTYPEHGLPEAADLAGERRPVHGMISQLLSILGLTS